ncbi:hypothetical protein WUBG_05052 [Wuchereria bancrofti]|uniref:Uncharacterized protein n=1 Tax=Wuchereria bancrofti TaxID=6293 RepID=J9EPE9_WUCBA|nr:hypothetical protein WUBG_05052 [Wuchereria bancrofti]
MNSDQCDLRKTIDPNNQIQKVMAEEDSKPRIARIRENLVETIVLEFKGGSKSLT